MTTAGRGVRDDEISAGGFRFIISDVWFWHDGFKNLRHYVPFAQNDWAKEDASGVSILSFPFDSGTGRIAGEINPATFGTHKIRKRIILPRDFGAFAPTQPITLITKRSAAVTSLVASLYNAATVDPGVNAVDVSPSVSATWETFTLTPSGAYNPGDFITFEIVYVAAANGRTVDIADLQLSYKTNRGNV